MTIEIFEPGSEEEKWAWSCLAMAKHFHEDHEGGAQPVGFVFGEDKSLSIVALAAYGDWNEWRTRDLASEALKRICADTSATFVAILSDCWRTKIEDTDELRREGLRPLEFKQWTREQQARFRVQRGEALMLIMESRTMAKGIYQDYTRGADGTLIWGEVVVMEGPPEGRFTGLLPKGRQ